MTRQPPTTHSRSRYAEPRCALTGARLDPAARILRVGSRERVTPSGYDDTPAKVDIRPLKLHTQETDAGGLGGLMWSIFFSRYIAPALPADVEAGDKEQVEWWRVDYAIDRVRRGFLQLYTAERAEQALDAVLAVLCERRDPADVATEVGHTEYWVGDRCRTATWLAFRRDITPLKRRT